MSDERLNYLASRFVELDLAKLLRITFEQYLADPEGWDMHATYLVAGGGLNVTFGVQRPVALQ
ncbi:MAG: hypothetical protein AB7D06_17070 [Pedobacter sp.]